ncbi:MAG: hypothetical protein ACXVWW_05825 [Nocardioides sp.]
MTTAQEALRLAEGYVFGTDPGRLPALLHDALQHTEEGAVRARLGATLARLWSFAGEPGRAIPFAEASRADAEGSGDPVVVADALDACLAAHWGVDEIDVRRDLAHQLDEVTAHLLDPEARLRAHVWLLTCASERLDIAAMNRQMRALELLAEGNPRAMTFAASRRLMLDLLRGRLDTLPALVTLEEQAQAAAPDPDGFMVLGCMRGYGGAITGDRAMAAQMAELCEATAEAEGIVGLYAEAAWMWWGGGVPDRARRLIEQYDADSLAALPGDFNYLLTLQLALDVAVETNALRLIEEITPLLLPYAGRAVINAGAVMFHGVTDDPLARATALLGDAATSARLRASALATYRRIGASWWRTRLEEALPLETRPANALSLRRGAPGIWLVGASETPVPERRGLEHLHALLASPGVDLHVSHLAGTLVEEADVGPVADATAMAAYRRRLRELETALDEADLSGDPEASAAAQAEREAILTQVAAASGLGGRARRAGGSTERTRVAVKKAISAAIAAIEATDAEMAAHLREHVRTGTWCCYRPAGDEIEWRL